MFLQCKLLHPAVHNSYSPVYNVPAVHNCYSPVYNVPAVHNSYSPVYNVPALHNSYSPVYNENYTILYEYNKARLPPVPERVASFSPVFSAQCSPPLVLYYLTKYKFNKTMLSLQNEDDNR